MGTLTVVFIVAVLVWVAWSLMNVDAPLYWHWSSFEGRWYLSGRASDRKATPEEIKKAW